MVLLQGQRASGVAARDVVWSSWTASYGPIFPSNRATRMVYIYDDGPPPELERERPQWMTHYAIFYLPRPWVLWMWWLPSGQRPINIPMELSGLLAVGAFGLVRIRRELLRP